MNLLCRAAVCRAAALAILTRAVGGLHQILRGHFLVAATATTPLKAKAILIKALYASSTIFVVLQLILDFDEKLSLLFFILKQFLGT